MARKIRNQLVANVSINEIALKKLVNKLLDNSIYWDYLKIDRIAGRLSTGREIEITAAGELSAVIVEDEEVYGADFPLPYFYFLNIESNIKVLNNTDMIVHEIETYAYKETLDLYSSITLEDTTRKDFKEIFKDLLFKVYKDFINEILKYTVERNFVVNEEELINRIKDRLAANIGKKAAELRFKKPIINITIKGVNNV